MSLRQNRSSVSVITLALVCGLSGPAIADSVYWNGGVSGDWFTNGNWVWGGHTPGAGDDARIDMTGVVVSGASGEVNSLFVGINSEANLTVNSALSSQTLTLGYNAGSSGLLTVDGASTEWTNSGAAYVGGSGEGEVRLLNGAGATTGQMFIGSGLGGDGLVSLSDGSTLDVTTELFIGYAGDATSPASGSLSVESGSAVTSATANIADGLNSSGDVTVDGQGSTFSTTGLLVVGVGGVGTMTILDGATVENDSATIGNSLTASGSYVDISGTGSSWDVTNNLIVGASGSAELTVGDGAAVTSGSTYVGYAQGSSSDLSIDAAVMTVSDRIGVGFSGTGTLTVENGASLTCNGAIVGWNSTGSGTATVSGTSSSWQNTGVLFIGNEGDGDLVVSGGASVTSTDGYVGTEDGSVSTAILSGDSSWAMSGTFFAGHSSGSQGTVTLTDGASISGLQGILGDLAGSLGIMTVDGSGSSWSANVDENVLYSGDLNVGRHGEGELVISDGGSVSGHRLHIANEAGSEGTVEVTGSGSNITLTGQLSIGLEGDAEITVSDHATITASNVVIASDTGSSGTLVIGENSGTINVDSVSFGAGDGRIDFDHDIDGYDFAADMSGAGDLRFISGETVLTGNYSDFTGEIIIAGGSLYANTGTINVTSTVESGATLGGSGRLGNVLVNAGGIVAPGNSIGTLTVANIDYAAGSIYSVEIDDAGNSDLVHATGAVTIDSAASVHVSPENGTDDGSTYTIGTTYTILTADGGVTGTFGSLTDDFAFLNASLSYDANNIYLSLLRSNVSFASMAQTPNQRATAFALDTITGTNALVNAVAATPDALVQPTFDALSGEIHASARTILMNDAHYLRDALNARLTDAGPGEGFWIAPFGATGNFDAQAGIATVDHTASGAIAGLDGELANGWRLGLAGGYSHTGFDVDARSSSGSSDNVSIAAYGSHVIDAFSLRFGASGSWHEIETDRSVIIGSLNERIDASYDAYTTQLFGEASYEFKTGAVTLSPYAGLAHISQSRGTFAESGGESAVSGSRDTIDTVYSTVGLRVEAPVEIGGAKVELSGMVGWRHLFNDEPILSTHRFGAGSAFQIEGASISGDVALAQAGLSFELAANARLNLSYAGQFGDGMQEQRVNGRFALNF